MSMTPDEQSKALQKWVGRSDATSSYKSLMKLVEVLDLHENVKFNHCLNCLCGYQKATFDQIQEALCRTLFPDRWEKGPR